MVPEEVLSSRLLVEEALYELELEEVPFSVEPGEILVASEELEVELSLVALQIALVAQQSVFAGQMEVEFSLVTQKLSFVLKVEVELQF